MFIKVMSSEFGIRFGMFMINKTNRFILILMQVEYLFIAKIS